MARKHYPNWLKEWSDRKNNLFYRLIGLIMEEINNMIKPVDGYEAGIKINNQV